MAIEGILLFNVKIPFGMTQMVLMVLQLMMITISIIVNIK